MKVRETMTTRVVTVTPDAPVPVIRDAGRKTLTEIARQSRDLITRARERKLTPDELAAGFLTAGFLTRLKELN